MTSELDVKAKRLEELELDDEIASKRMSIAQKRAIEKEMKAQYGSGWRKVVGIVGKVGSLRVNSDSVQTLYASNPELRELNRPSGRRLR